MIVHVSIPNTGQNYYDYLRAEHQLELGSRVRVSFRRQVRVGIVVGFSQDSAFLNRLKPVIEVLDETPQLTKTLLSFYDWVAMYYHALLCDVLHFALPKYYREGRRLVASTLSYPLVGPRPNLHKPYLNEEQRLAVDTMRKALGTYQCFMLQGVTGSGKTEVYLRVIETVLSLNGQVLVLVPEIGLTPQFLARFQARFHVPFAVMHSHLSDTARFEAWSNAVKGDARIVIGTRTALFTPLPHLSLIVVDEEHDASFKQQDALRYSARDCALIRARLSQVPVILGTATPSLETYHNMQQGKYQLLRLTRKALSTVPLHFQLVDLRTQATKEGLAPVVYQKIEAHLKLGHQVLVFMNRRGFAPILFCQSCNFIADCPACERHYTVHQKLNRLICHHCGRQHPIIQSCPSCKANTLTPIGAGTQRLYQTLVKHFPQTNIAQIDRDELKKKDALETALDAIAKGETQLMVGTQLLAKGHHFPNLTLVVVVDADSGLYHPDFRAIERLGQLLLQVSGRAGRAEHPGEVLIQTHMPQHPALNQLIQEGYDAFAQSLLNMRKIANLPPYQHLCVVRAKGRALAKVEAFLNRMKAQLNTQQVQVLGPAPALMPKKAGLYRMQLCCMAPTRQALHEQLQRIAQVETKGSGVKWSMDVDPVDLV